MEDLLRNFQTKLWGQTKERLNGQAMVEYSLIIVLVVIVCIGIVSQIGDTLKTGFYDIIGDLPL